MKLKKPKTHSKMQSLASAGQSPWLDFISREILTNGKLKGMIRNGLLGVTSNPSIFEKAINQPGAGYDADIQRMLRSGKAVLEIYDALTISDIQAACDLFSPVFKGSKGEHGFVSLEVMPCLANDTEGTIRDAVRLFGAVGRPNVMIKIPATVEGIAAVREVIARGVNVNVTLMFTVKHYQAVAEAYLQGLSAFQKKGGDLSKVHSVASIFVSRFDTYLDKKLDDLIRQKAASESQSGLKKLLGQAAIANSKLIYQEFKRIFYSARFENLKSKGAWIQKVLWGSTSTKNPDYFDLMYVSPLIGRETVNTIPLATLEAFLDHGEVREDTVEKDVLAACQISEEFKKLGFDLGEVGNLLQQQGVKAFSDSFETLMGSLEKIREQFVGKRFRVKLPQIRISIGDDSVKQAVRAKVQAFESEKWLERFLKKDPGLWKSDAEHQKVIQNRLGWLTVCEWIRPKLYEIDLLRQEILAEKFKDIILLGMGGSSLAPEVMSLICKKLPKSPRFRILDSTDPASILALEHSLNLRSTLFIVASKSGSTIETVSQMKYFYSRVSQNLGKDASKESIGRHFISITDSGSELEKQSARLKFRKVFLNPSDIGGRYSAMSLFGMVPAALAGIDVRLILRQAKALYESVSQPCTLEKNLPIYLGVVLGCLAVQGRDKLTFIFSRSLESFGTWLEQLIAESTGKEGKGILPIAGESLSAGALQTSDRYFVGIRLKSEPFSKADAQRIQKIKQSKGTWIEIEWPAEASIGAEFLGWEIITAVSSAVLGVNPFDEPNVKESKDITGKLLGDLRKSGTLPEPSELLSIRSFIPFETFLTKVKSGGYLAVLAYVERSTQYLALLRRLQKRLGDVCQVPVLLGFGPRYLHSIGQFYKGGQRTGRFIQFLKTESRDVAVPETGYSFGQLIRAQALGDCEAMASKGLSVLPLDLGKDIVSGLLLFEKRLREFQKR